MAAWVIRTKRLKITPLTRADAAEFAAWSGDARVARMTGSFLTGWDAGAAADWIEARKWQGEPGGVFAIRLISSGEMIGQVGMGGDPLDIGYTLAPDQWGQGYASEAAAAMIDACQARYARRPEIARCFQDNPASARVLEKLGFERAGEEMGHSASRLEPAPNYIYRLKPLEGRAT